MGGHCVQASHSFWQMDAGMNQAQHAQDTCPGEQVHRARGHDGRELAVKVSWRPFSALAHMRSSKVLNPEGSSPRHVMRQVHTDAA